VLRLHFTDRPAGGRVVPEGLSWATARTRCGSFRVVAEPDAVVRVEFGGCVDPLPASRTDTGPAVGAARWIEAHLDGGGTGSEEAPDVLVRYHGATTFARSVWTALVAVPSGRTVTYGALATAIGRPGAARAVGGACARNPVPLVVPCHRVVASAGPGGYAGGAALKWSLLRAEAG
jgi:methylated-DNA-[protein]-cysteine S-methyltransferase